jgi:hypothetical protein
MKKSALEISDSLAIGCPNMNFENDYLEPIIFEDEINKPSHYHKNEIDVNGYLEKHFPKEANVTVAEGFYIGNIIKYVSRHKEKGGMRDLEKAKFYIDKLMDWRSEHA